MPKRTLPSILAILLTFTLFPADAALDEVRAPCCAGTWYPGDAEDLARAVDGLIDGASPPRIEGKPLALISPHAGYRFSAPVAAAGYKTLEGHSYKRVIVIAFSHRYASSYEGVDVPKSLTAYRTPLGDVPIDKAACDELLKSDLYSSHSNIDREEHSLELQLPFLQRAVPGFKLVPLLVGKMTARDYAKAAEALLPLLDEETLIVVSSDFTHFGANYGYRPFRSDVPAKLQELADKAYAPLANADFDGFVQHLEATDDTICGRGPILLLLRTLSMQGGAKGIRAAVDTSGRMLDDWANSVTYQSIVFVPRPNKLDPLERAMLLRLARQTVTAQVSGQDGIHLNEDEIPTSLKSEGASFVTLKNQGELRGCIGNMTANGPLWKSVVQNSVMACQDYRFARNPVTTDELDEIELEVSYLTPLKRISGPDEIVVGRDGLLLRHGRQSGVLLPQVAYERGWTREEFLEALCMKAGVHRGTWKRKDAVLYSFEAEVFSEHELHP
jgi:AmmeMemoRadiSam system protein B/AmmeMemoRadiSam system protein A